MFLYLSTFVSFKMPRLSFQERESAFDISTIRVSVLKEKETLSRVCEGPLLLKVGDGRSNSELSIASCGAFPSFLRIPSFNNRRHAAKGKRVSPRILQYEFNPHPRTRKLPWETHTSFPIRLRSTNEPVHQILEKARHVVVCNSQNRKANEPERGSISEKKQGS